MFWGGANGKYRDTRRFWKGDTVQGRTWLNRLTGSSDLYELSGRLNFVTAHDGFPPTWSVTAAATNGEENRDGINENLSWNCGAEGHTGNCHFDSSGAYKRNFLATLLLSRGVPMLLAGDEMGTDTQRETTMLTARSTNDIFLDQLGFGSASPTIARVHPVPD